MVEATHETEQEFYRQMQADYENFSEKLFTGKTAWEMKEFIDEFAFVLITQPGVKGIGFKIQESAVWRWALTIYTTR